MRRARRWSRLVSRRCSPLVILDRMIPLASADTDVDTDEIRPDWETKLNAVKAAAARKASRRIVMRQASPIETAHIKLTDASTF